MAPEIKHVEPIDDKPVVIDNELRSKSLEIIEELVSDEAGSVNNEPEISLDLPVNDELKSGNEESNIQLKTYPPGYILRAEREKRLRQWAVDHGEDPDKFVTITEKDRNLAYTYHDRLCSDADMIQFAKDTDDDPNTLMDMSRRERLISEEIMLRLYEDDGNPRARSYDDEEWIEKIAILQENGYLW
ncbi:9397_t:CDS:1 [Paraglomus occultum]|uniref:9397_t:CDS:1 n=1 Tax=Paraglomus occultum TaxID=144539 RepID=A0A9N8VKU8_9GLOM|nr:9397_t:CDS:1 [Paraglomus occultum]